jgi:hypothetical protein
MKVLRHWNVQKSCGNYLGDRARAAPQNSGDEKENGTAGGTNAVRDGESRTRSLAEAAGGRRTDGCDADRNQRSDLEASPAARHCHPGVQSRSRVRGSSPLRAQSPAIRFCVRLLLHSLAEGRQRGEGRNQSQGPRTSSVSRIPTSAIPSEQLLIAIRQEMEVHGGMDMVRRASAGTGDSERRPGPRNGCQPGRSTPGLFRSPFPIVPSAQAERSGPALRHLSQAQRSCQASVFAYGNQSETRPDLTV